MIESEVIIVGGGPAGAACAWKLNQARIQTLILDKTEFPRLKLCAGWVTPKVFKYLQIAPSDYPHSLLRFNTLHFSFHGKRLPVKTRQFSIRRIEFDEWLLKRAGVPIHHHEVKNIRRDGGYYILDEQYRCRYLVGAGGTNCPVYRSFFRQEHPRETDKLIVTLEAEFPNHYQNKNCYLWFFDRDLPGYSWYVPKGKQFLNIGIGAKQHDLKSGNETLRDHWNYFVERLQKNGLLEGDVPTAKGYSYYLRQKNTVIQKDTVFLAGDAAGLATLDMGEGIRPAIASGIRAANAILGISAYSVQSIGKYSFRDILFPW